MAPLSIGADAGLDRSGRTRCIELRVGYDRGSGDRGWVNVETVRAG